jgi:osmotically-inducible protein OsmY
MRTAGSGSKGTALARDEKSAICECLFAEKLMPPTCLIEPDLRFRYIVLRELDWDPRVNARGLEVATSGGTVTLSGVIDSCAGKRAAERAVKRLRGVRHVINQIVVQPTIRRTDEELTHDAAGVLASAALLPPSVQVVVKAGQLTLTGHVEWLFQRELAEHLAANVRGIREVQNEITVEPHASCVDVRRRIIRALHQLATIDRRHIDVSVQDRTVTLSGTVNSWAEHDAAGDAAARTEGVTRVNNQIVVSSEPATDEIA